MQVALQRLPQLPGRALELGRRVLGLEVGQVVGHLTGVRLQHDRGGLGPDALEVGQRPRADPAVQLGVGEPLDHVRRRPEGRHPVGGFAGALQEEGDPPERVRGRHGQRPTDFVADFACLAAFFWALAACFEAFS